MFYSVDEAGNLVKAIVIGVVAFVTSFLITLLVYRDKEERPI